jgi:hypothetical protein
MALQTTNVDDRSYDQLVDVLRKQIPVSLWTDHNPSDPGIMLLELLCWLGEMTLYRMNLVPDAHRQKFLNLLIDPPQPVTVDVTFTVNFDPPSLPLASDIVIPMGTRLATDFVNGHRFVFETLATVTFDNPPPGIFAASETVKARELLAVTNDVLGTSDGSPNQTFQLSPPLSLRTSPEQYLPVLLDFVNASAAYQPNPQVEVNGSPWDLVPFLLTDASKVPPANSARHFMVEPFENRIRFGDDRFGAIPPAGAAIVCTRYQVLQGPSALVASNQLLYILDPVLNLSTHALVMTHEDADGGLNIFPPDVRIAEGLKNFRGSYRVVTNRDFEIVLLEDYNDFQDLSSSTPKLVRAVPIMNRRPPLQQQLEAPGHITILVLRTFDESIFQNPAIPLTVQAALALTPPKARDEFLLQNPAVPVAVKEAALELTPAEEGKILRFLEERRLITTHLHVVTPHLLPLQIAANVIVFKDRNTAEMDAVLRKKVSNFLSILKGDFDGHGWRLGRDVYRSQIFRVLEEVDGVDYVKLLVLSPADAAGNVAIAPDQLPVLQNLVLSVERD